MQETVNDPRWLNVMKKEEEAEFDKKELLSMKIIKNILNFSELVSN